VQGRKITVQATKTCTREETRCGKRSIPKLQKGMQTLKGSMIILVARYHESEPQEILEYVKTKQQ
jgi:hypothetical protein